MVTKAMCLVKKTGHNYFSAFTTIFGFVKTLDKSLYTDPGFRFIMGYYFCSLVGILFYGTILFGGDIFIEKDPTGFILSMVFPLILMPFYLAFDQCYIHQEVA